MSLPVAHAASKAVLHRWTRRAAAESINPSTAQIAGELRKGDKNMCWAKDDRCAAFAKDDALPTVLGPTSRPCRPCGVCRPLIVTPTRDSSRWWTPAAVTSLQAHEPVCGGDVGLRAVSGGEGDRLAVSQGPGCEMGHGDVQRVQGADAMLPGHLKRDPLDILLW